MMELYELLATRGTEGMEATATGTKQLADPDKPDGGLAAMLETMMMPYDEVIGVLEQIKGYNSRLYFCAFGPKLRSEKNSDSC